ncbi:MAG: gliding motility-associated C-terminal domain-containing protein, partial [Bacteroidota bacterium]
QIFVNSCDNSPPLVQAPDELCVVAGDTLRFEVQATDFDQGNLVQLTAIGAPINSAYSPATFAASPVHLPPPVTGLFQWITACEHISRQPYSVVFKATDSLDFPELADLKTTQIKVVGPPPRGVQADASQSEVIITWDKPYRCEDAAENYFLGFSVWRREGSNPFVPDICSPGLAGKGYEEIIFITKLAQDGRYRYADEEVERGRTYCYRVLAKFARRSAAGYPYNIVESLPSAEVCVQLPRDLPLVTNVSVEETGVTDGKIRVVWSKPVAEDLDTVINHGPYRYQLLRAPGLTGGLLQEVPGASFTASSFIAANDTVYEFDGPLNTVAGGYHYQVDFYVKGNVLLGSTNEASSVFLAVSPSDKANILSWQAEVPWNNFRHVIYRKNPGAQSFDSVGVSDKPYYEDRGLINGELYCYYVRTVGTYSISGVKDPLHNLSQQVCS